MRSEQGEQTRGIEEGERSQVDHDLFRRRRSEDVLESPLDPAA
jgi:hypothetical protein